MSGKWNKSSKGSVYLLGSVLAKFRTELGFLQYNLQCPFDRSLGYFGEVLKMCPVFWIHPSKLKRAARRCGFAPNPNQARNDTFLRNWGSVNYGPNVSNRIFNLEYHSTPTQKTHGERFTSLLPHLWVDCYSTNNSREKILVLLMKFRYLDTLFITLFFWKGFSIMVYVSLPIVGSCKILYS